MERSEPTEDDAPPSHTAADDPSDDLDGLTRRLADAEMASDPLDRQAVLARVQRGLFAAVDQPLRIGRFVVVERLGAGASGVVYAAYDPKLDRKVALKLLRPDADGNDEAHARLRREALALAKLSHPHVVAIHDVGEVDGRVFIAMEHLPGGTLRRFAEGGARRPQDVLAAYLQAGEGLAAAHAAGLVHRDFKPDNVLLDRRGQVRVVDFGLARDQGGGAGRSMIEVVATGEATPPELDANLTQTGTVLGTPAYMAPEQLAGRPADARTDQYAFCVALYEALHGERPFAGDTLAALTVAATRGVVRPPPPGHAVPARIRRALLRGLRPDPAERHPDMAALLQALRRDSGARWRRGGLFAAGLVAAVGLTWMLADRPHAATPAPCSGLARRLEGVWDEARQASVARAFVDGEHPRGAEIWALVRPRLDEYAGAWAEARTDACEATEVRREQSAELLDRRVLCLDRAHAVLRAAVDRLEHADRQVVARATQIAPDRAIVDDCSATGVLDDGEPPPPDPEVRKAVQALEDRVAEAYSLQQAGQYTQALAKASVLVDDAAALGHAPTHARALVQLAAALTQSRRPQEAIAALARAVALAERGRADRTRAQAQHLLVKRLADTGRHDEARRLAAATEGVYARLARPPEGVPMAMELMWGYIEWIAGNYDDAIDRFSRAVALGEGASDPSVQVLHSEAVAHLGTVMQEAGRSRDALPLVERALALRGALIGSEHPEMASIHGTLGAVRLALGEHELAERELRRSLEIRERMLGADHESMAQTLSNLGALAMQAGRVEEALGYMRRALGAMERSLGPQSPELAAPLHNMALAHLRLGQPGEALVLVKRAVELRRRGLGEEHAKTIQSVYQLGYVEKEAGNLDAAKVAFEEHLRLLEEHRPEDAESLAHALVGVADVALLQGRPRDAEEAMERALPLLGDGSQAELRVAVRFNLARALGAMGKEPGRARRLAEAALVETSEESSEPHHEIERWLAKNHPDVYRPTQ